MSDTVYKFRNLSIGILRLVEHAYWIVDWVFFYIINDPRAAIFDAQMCKQCTESLWIFNKSVRFPYIKYSPSVSQNLVYKMIAHNYDYL